MPLVVRAQVADIRCDGPRVEERFFLDTNVWYWLCYSKASASGAAPYQLKDYPEFVEAAYGVGARLEYCPETVAELAHVIERKEYDLHVATAGIEPKHYGVKDFRRDPALRADVVREVNVAWATMQSMGQCLTGVRDEAAAVAALAELQTAEIDGYDAFLISAARAHKSTAIVTDDADFLSSTGVVVLTANNRALAAAKMAGKFVKR